ncbi:MAG: aromatic acid exporter family protein [Acholeplasmataceae bacterium]
MKRYMHTTIKMSIAFVITIVIAELLSLDYAITAGILAVLSIQSTNKDSIVIAIKRFSNATIGLVLGSIFFVLFGYNVYAFLGFSMLFIFISFFFKLPEGIVPTLVLVSHLLLFSQFSWIFLGQEFLLITIAIGVALLLNLIYPLNSQKQLLAYIKSIDQMMTDHVFMLSLLFKDLKHPRDFLIHHDQINSHIKEIIDLAELVDKDILIANDHRYIAYLYMRRTQLKHINHIYALILKVETHHENIHLIANYIKELSGDIGCFDRASGQLEKLNDLLLTVKDQALPKSRAEFETRAILFQIVDVLSTFLETKIQFHQTYPMYDCNQNKSKKE